MDVSVIIVNYNTFEMTTRCIRWVYEKTSGVNFEIILVDNASTEQSPDGFLEIFPNIKLIKSKSNLGFSGGNNLGIKEAAGKYILLLNSDAFLENNALLFAYQKMEKDQRIGVLSCQLKYPDGLIQSVCGRFPSLSCQLKELLRFNKGLTAEEKTQRYLGDCFDHQSEREVDWVWGAFFMIKKEVINNFSDKKLPDDYFMYGEDVLWCYLIKKMGYKIYYDPTGKVIHLMAGSSKKESISGFERYVAKMLPNEYDFIKKHKGQLYVKLFFLVKALHHLTLRTKNDLVKAKAFGALALRKPK